MLSAASGTSDRLCALQDENLTFHWRGMPLDREAVRLADFPKYGWNLLQRSLLTPTLVVKETALRHNISLMAAYCRSHGVLHAPHLKTSMSPQLAWQLIEAGGWATSVATADQIRVMREFGLRRILLANQFAAPQEVRWIAQELAKDPEFEFWCLVDSEEGVAWMSAALAGLPMPRPLRVLIEVGIDGGRAGCRTLADVERTARAVHESPALALAGIELYEAMAARGESVDDKIGNVDKALRFAGECFEHLRDRDLFADVELLLSAGGSLYFDRVVEIFAHYLSDPRTAVVLRGGCVVTHEVGASDALSPLSGRGEGEGALKQALELWSSVISMPEPGLAVLNFGKRDAPFDKGNPVAFAISRSPGHAEQLTGPMLSIRSINDHHTVINIPEDFALAVGDLVAFHVTHSCTAFDKWRLVPVVDDQYGIHGGLVTFL
jgi:D-serine dehydratase